MKEIPPAPTPTPPPALPPPVQRDDWWMQCLSEFRQGGLPGGLYGMLVDSQCEAAGTALDGEGKPVPLYRIAIAPRFAANGLSHFTHQAGPAIRRKLGSVLGRPIVIEIAAAITEPEPTP